MNPDVEDRVLTGEQLYDSIGSAYEIAYAGSQSKLDSIQWVLTQLEGRPKPSRILDIGCGTGVPVCSCFADAGHHVLGIDVSAVMLQSAREQVPNARFEKQDVYTMSPATGTYDAITVYFSLLCDRSQNQIRDQIRKMYDWLVPGGVFVFATIPNDSNDSIVRWAGRTFRGSSLNAEGCLDAVKNAGFEIVSYRLETFTDKSAEVGICKPGETAEETQIFVYAVKR